MWRGTMSSTRTNTVPSRQIEMRVREAPYTPGQSRPVLGLASSELNRGVACVTCVALLGMGLIVFGDVRLVVQACRRDVQRFIEGGALRRVTMALCLVLLPIALHTQLEWPTLSVGAALHGAPDGTGYVGAPGRRVVGMRRLPVSGGAVLRTLLPVASIGVVVLMAFAYRGAVAHPYRACWPDGCAGGAGEQSSRPGYRPDCH
ncbi:Uncharacterised protein [Serratia fonticola]|nr:Uncharacterised protein [Serratia fonticola]CAI1180400.1 Uncharacterised protein [Serratia fonticola]